MDDHKATPRQAIITVVYGSHGEQLNRTFTSFLQNGFAELHAFIIGDRLPSQRIDGIQYHLEPPDASYSHPMRDADFRRWLFPDKLDVEFALVVDGNDALCLRPLPPIPQLLRGASVGAVVEHSGGRYLENRLYTANFLNAGVTFWHVPSTRQLRRDIVDRGRTSFRNLTDDQLCFNELLQTRYLDDLIILPNQYNYRAFINQWSKGWPRVKSIDGVRIYHNAACIETVKAMLPVADHATLSPLANDGGAISPAHQWWRRLRQRLKPHIPF